MSNVDIEVKEAKVEDGIAKNLGERLVIRGGRDYDVPVARVVVSTFADAGEEEKAIYIGQGKTGISLSLESLEKIVAWAKVVEEQKASA